MYCLSNSELADKSDCVYVPEEILMQKQIQMGLPRRRSMITYQDKVLEKNWFRTWLTIAGAK